MYSLTSDYLSSLSPDYILQPEQKKRLLIFSNVKYPVEQKIATRPTDILCFLNSCHNSAYYQHDNVEKILCWHRTDHRDFGPKIVFAENHYVTQPREIPAEFIEALEKKYDWNYTPRPGRKKCLTTGYIVVKWLEKNYPDREITLVNFGMDVQGSTRRSSDHNWQFEDREMQIFPHLYTASAKNFRKRKIFLVPNAWLGDTIIADAVMRNILATGMFEVNIDFRGKKQIWENCPYLNPEITRQTADNVFRMRNRDRWRQDCRHIIAGNLNEFAGYIGENIPCQITTPQIYMKLASERLIEQKYVLINTGWQNSAPTKKWSQSYWQQLVDMTPEIAFVQMGTRKNHARPLRGAINMIDKTNCAQLAQLVRDAECVISPPSGVVHIAAALNRKSIVLAGGREPAHLTAYPDDIVFSKIGKLSCCRRGGCHHSCFFGDRRICNRGRTVGDDNYPTAQCMVEITPQAVAEELKKILKI